MNNRREKGLRRLYSKWFILIFLGLIAVTMIKVNAGPIDEHPLSPDPVEICWYVTDASGTPQNGASLTIMWAISPDGPFKKMPHDDPEGTYIIDRIPDPDIRQNPIYTGDWNPDYPSGMAVSEVHPAGGLSGLYFYVEIEYDSVTEYWPTAASYKPGDPTWEPVAATGSESGYAAAGPGIGTGPTTAYPTGPCPPPGVIPEVPLGSIMASVTIVVAFAAYFGLRRQKLRTPL